MNDTPNNNAKRKTWHRVWFWLGCVALLAVFGVLVLNGSGKSAWDHYRHEWEAKGERFDFASFVPKPVPDDRNFALTPVVASCYSRILDKNGRQISPEKTNIIDRLQLNIYGDNGLVKTPTNGIGNRSLETTSDLKVWQNYYRTLAAVTNQFPVPSQPQSPAADVLMALSKYDSYVEELRMAARLPDSRFPLNYDANEPFLILLPHLAALKRSSQALQLRAIAELQNDQSALALADIKLMLRLTEALRTEPFLISHLVRIAIVQIVLQPIWEGLVEHRWTDAQLAELNLELAKLDFLADYEFSMRGERACSIAAVEDLRRKRNFQQMFNGDLADLNSSGDNQEAPALQAVAGVAYHLIPASVFYRNELAIARMHQQYLLPIVDVGRRMASPAIARQAGLAIEDLRAHWSPNTIIACLLLPALESTVKKYAHAQSSVDLARIACALERYQHAHGNYPESLEALAPQFIETVPHDLINGQPLHYLRTPAGAFLLYSVGWDETDDGGQTGLNKSGRVDISKGDWIWPGAAKGSQ